MNQAGLSKSPLGTLLQLALAIVLLPVATHGSIFPRGTNLVALYTINESYLSTDGLRMLMASLQGLVARQSPTQFMTTGGTYSNWRDHLRDSFAIPCTSVTDPWVLVDRFKTLTAGYVLFDLANSNSINVAASCAGPFNALAVDRALESQVRSHGITNLLADLSSRNENWAWTNQPSLFNPRLVIEQRESLCLALRDYGPMANAFSFYDGNSNFRRNLLSALDPDAANLGWGDTSSGENVPVADGSDRGIFTVPADYARDLSTLSSLRAPAALQRTRVQLQAQTNVHYVAFLVTDGDNVQWNLGGMRSYFNHPARGSFDMGWALSPSLAELAPSVPHWYFAQASNGPGHDFFVSGPSGIGYMYPSRYPPAELDLHVQRLNELAGFADLRIVQVLDFGAFNRPDLWAKYTLQPNIDAIFYLEYSRYDSVGGTVLWSNGKPVVSARKMLWSGLSGADEASVTASLNSAARDPYTASGYSLVMVHAWSKNLSNVLAVVTNLSPAVRVVTPDTLVRLMKSNIAAMRSFDFGDGLQGWAPAKGAKAYDRADWTGGMLRLDGSDLGAPDSNPNAWFSRPLTLPADAQTLRFDTRADNDGLLRVRLRKSDGSFVTLLDWSALADHDWHTLDLSIAAFAGQDVTLYFEQNDGGSGSGEYRYLDNVLILAAAVLPEIPPDNIQAAQLVGQGAIWKYLDNNVAPPASWTGLGYDDSGWPVGPSRLGYGGDSERTVLGYGPNINAKYITTWFRHSFVSSPAGQCRALLLRVLADDGVILYLNGAEIWRYNLPSGAISPSTLADTAISGADEYIFHLLELDPGLLRPGANVLAAEVHQSSGTSSDLAFNLELSGEFVLPVPLVAAGSSWKFLDDGSDQGLAWRSLPFDDSTWPAGLARLGYGGDGEVTTLSYGPNPASKYITTYFRRTFTATDPADYGPLRMLLQADAGAIVYLNGTEVFRSRLPAGPVDYSTFAITNMPDPEEHRFTGIRLPDGLLLQGTNLLAVELHQASANNADLGFDLALLTDSGRISASLSGRNLTLAWPSGPPASRVEMSSLRPVDVWSPAGYAALSTGGVSSLTLPTSFPTRFYRLRQDVVDSSTIWHKHLLGYQGWFACTNDGGPPNGWVHWFRSQLPVATNATVDFWPDISELGPDELFSTGMTLPDGSPARVYGAAKPATVLRHFRWMQEARIDGVMLQRFSSELRNRTFFEWRNQVACNVRAGAEAYGRVFTIMYDISGQPEATLVPDLQNDWNYLVNTLRITATARYLRHNGKPVVAIWGLGFTDRPGTPAQAQELIAWFKAAGVCVMGGVPTNWRTLSGDSKTDLAWLTVYRSFDILSPWTVGRYSSDSGADNFRVQYIEPDLADCNTRGVIYLPVVWPGFSWHNLKGATLNSIPRRGGRFYWRQVYNAIAAGAPCLYGAMFDEVDEGTAMFKLAPTAAQLPAQGSFVPLDIDGESLPADWYLRLAGEASRMLRRELLLTPTRPINP